MVRIAKMALAGFLVVGIAYGLARYDEPWDAGRAGAEAVSRQWAAVFAALTGGPGLARPSGHVVLLIPPSVAAQGWDIPPRGSHMDDIKTLVHHQIERDIRSIATPGTDYNQEYRTGPVSFRLNPAIANPAYDPTVYGPLYWIEKIPAADFPSYGRMCYTVPRDDTERIRAFERGCR